ncbi:PAS domain S-box protein [Methanoplanus limicola]|uniref:histidine kinase n=1 Tax=Methanoplanus limicola DSM 2279 TaxID=937775 RepID=H1YY75_9EURY|nr:PAS domain S-box protein [Methanoplanus limicola]EHQ34170.1 PAS sensor protein [Methanoplanus limicola DSM 2279]
MENISGYYENIFEYAGAGLILSNSNEDVILSNRAFSEISGYSRDEIENNMKWPEFIHPDDLKPLYDKYRRFSEDKAGFSRIFEFRLKKKDGSERYVAATVTHIIKNNTFVATFLDITEKKEMNQSLRRRDKILEAIGRHSQLFLESVSWKGNIKAFLSDLGEATGVSRIYLFENTAGPLSGEIMMNEISEWTAEGFEGQIKNPEMQKLTYEKAGVPRWKRVLSKKETIYADISSVDEAERANMEKLGVKSMIIAPVFIIDRWWGFIGFDESEEERKWTKAEIDTLGAAAGIIGSSIYRQESYEEMLSYMNESALRLKNPTSIVNDNLAEIITDLQSRDINTEIIISKLIIQMKNIEQINNNLNELNRSIVERRNEIPDYFRRFITG